MPNWVTNWLTILVPRDKADAMKEALKGPNFWVGPALPWDRRNGVQISNHQRLGIDQDGAALVEQYREKHKNGPRPDWMPVSRTDIELMIAGVEEDMPETVPFSLPRLAPIKDLEDFHHFFPGQQNGPFWEPDESRKRDYDMAECGVGAVCRHRTGTAKILFEIELSEPEGEINPDDRYAPLLIKYDTAWSALGNLRDNLMQVLVDHDAKALLIWEEEQGFTGYEYINPAEDIWLLDDFNTESNFIVEDEPDEDGYAHRYVDREALEEHVHASIEDDDFVNRF
jgi:hypothetical protein